MSVFEKYGLSLGSSFRQFMIQMVNKLSYSQALIQNELNFEIGAFAPVRKQDSGMTNLKFSRLIYELDLMVRKAFRADSCRIVFIPEKYAMYGVFMEGPFNFRELVQVSLQGTLAQEIIQNKNCTCITMPSSLICG